MPTYGYVKDTDYQKLRDQAAANGDYVQAAIYEAQRNEKIVGEGLPYEQTNLYSSYLNGGGSNNLYTQTLEDAMARLGGAFSYDPEQDANYSAYKKQYLREADRTMKDTLGQYAAVTGGIPSTQAIAAASQAADNYKAKVADAIPAMREQAYGEWYNNQSLAMSQMQNQMTMAMERWAQLGYADAQVADVLGVAVGTPTTDQSYQNWAMSQQERSDAYSMAMTMLQSYIMPSAEMLAAAGISQEDAQKLYDAYQPSYSGGGYSSGGNGASGKVPEPNDEIWDTLYELYAAGETNSVNSWLARYAAAGYDSSMMAKIISDYGEVDLPHIPTPGGDYWNRPENQ